MEERGTPPALAVAQLDPEALEKARVKDDAQRERDLEGHLTNPQKGAAKGPKGDRQGDRQGVAMAEGAAAGPEVALLARDHQLRTAYQTLRSWQRFGKSKGDRP